MPEIENSDSLLGVINDTPELYTKIPCTVGFSYIRFEVDGTVRPCCISKHPIGDLAKEDWRTIWRSEAYNSFRAKLGRINVDKFHLTDPEFFFCQQCSHLLLNKQNWDAMNGVKADPGAG